MLYIYIKKLIKQKNLIKMKNLTLKTKTEIAAQMVIMDAIEKGHTNKDELIQYMNTEVFANAVKRYIDLF